MLSRGDHLQVVKTLSERISGYCEVTLETMAYAGTGDVLMVQKMLSIVGEHIEVEEGESWKARLLSSASSISTISATTIIISL